MSNQEKIMNRLLALHLEVHYAQGAVQRIALSSSSKGLQWSFVAPSVDAKLEDCVAEWLRAYEQRQPTSVQVPLAWQNLPSFSQQALYMINKIPAGTIMTYGQVAALLGKPTAARAVGSACRRNPFPLLIPCHRVLDSQHKMRGYSAANGIDCKEMLLCFEGYFGA